MNRYIALGLLCTTCYGLEKKPWFGNVYEFQFDSYLQYNRYTHIQNAIKQPSTPSNNYLLGVDLGVVLSPDWDVQTEFEMAKTPIQPFGWRSVALQGRYRFLDDIAGDPISLVLGGSIRGVSSHSVKDVNSPYSSYFNCDLSVAIGKEWSNRGLWTMRTYGYATLGFANHGSPWTSELFVWQGNWGDHHRLSLFADGYFGFGSKDHVDIKDFHGWGEYSHQSIDLGAAYGYHFYYWGTLSFAYAHRVFAHTYPEHVNFFTLTYNLPFSLF